MAHWLFGLYLQGSLPPPQKKMPWYYHVLYRSRTVIRVPDWPDSYRHQTPNPTPHDTHDPSWPQPHPSWHSFRHSILLNGFAPISRSWGLGVPWVYLALSFPLFTVGCWGGGGAVYPTLSLPLGVGGLGLVQWLACRPVIHNLVGSNPLADTYRVWLPPVVWAWLMKHVGPPIQPTVSVPLSQTQTKTTLPVICMPQVCNMYFPIILRTIWVITLHK